MMYELHKQFQKQSRPFLQCPVYRDIFCMTIECSLFFLGSKTLRHFSLDSPYVRIYLFAHDCML